MAAASIVLSSSSVDTEGWATVAEIPAAAAAAVDTEGWATVAEGPAVAAGAAAAVVVETEGGVTVADGRVRPWGKAKIKTGSRTNINILIIEQQ